MIGDNLQAVMSRIAAAVDWAGRAPGAVRLLAVSKTHAATRVAEAEAAGQRAFGENYVQEALEKMDALTKLLGESRARELEWHLIGPVQSNKTRAAAERFDWVQSVDREKIAQRLSQQRPAGLAPLNVLIEVNLSREASKSGVAVEDAAALARTIAGLPRLRLRGLMAIPAPSREQAVQRARFRAVRELFEQLRAQGLDLDTLSMGMSDDMEAAIAEGATMVRIGTAIFGAREKAKSAA